MAELPRVKYELNLVPVPFKPTEAKVIVGVASHDFVGDGRICQGVLGYERSHPLHNSPCHMTREAKIHQKLEVSKTACRVCGKEPQVMTFRGTGVCSELCRKERDGDIGPFRPTA